MTVCRLAAGVIAALAAGVTVDAQTSNGVQINIDTHTTTSLAPGFSGFNAPQPRNTVEYFDPKFIAATVPLTPGWLRFPGGTVSLAFDWQAAEMNVNWINYLTTGPSPLVDVKTANILTVSQQLTQAKGGVRLSDFASFAKGLGANAVICVNSYTDANPGSTAQLATAALGYGLNVTQWELGNEAYIYPAIFPTPASYGSSSYTPYFADLLSAAPGAMVGLFSAGLFPGLSIDYASWDNGLSAYKPRYWGSASVHVYPITSAISPADTMKTLNGVLAHGTVDLINSYLLPLVGASTPVFITELNCCTYTGTKFLSYLYNGIFLAEYLARMSTVPNVKAVGVNSLYTDNYDYHGILQSVDDFESYLLAQAAADPNFSTNTATDPNTQFQFYTSAPGLALEIANQVINKSKQVFATTVTGGSTVPILGYDGNPIPAVNAEAYYGNNGHASVLITNKAGKGRTVTIQVNGTKIGATLTLTSVSNTSAFVANSASAPNTVQIQATTSANPFQIGPYSVTSVTW